MKALDWRRLDVARAAREDVASSSEGSSTSYSRLRDAELPDSPPGRVQWNGQLEVRSSADGALTPWLHLQVRAELTLQCQRCLQALPEIVETQTHVRFVGSEAQAEAEDPDADEDVLALGAPLDVHALVEDEVLMALPLVPRHLDCQAPGPTQEALPGSQHPFAALRGLQTKLKDER